MTIELVRLAVRSGLFPVLEVENGSRWTINVEPDFSEDDLARYLSLQKRFKKSEIKPDEMGAEIDLKWKAVRMLAGCNTGV